MTILLGGLVYFAIHSLAALFVVTLMCLRSRKERDVPRIQMEQTHDETAGFLVGDRTVRARVRVWKQDDYTPVVIIDGSKAPEAASKIATYVHHCLLKGQWAAFIYVESIGDEYYGCQFRTVRHQLVIAARYPVDRYQVEAMIGHPIEN